MLCPKGKGALGGSDWLTRKIGRLGGDAPSIDLAAEAKLQKALLAMARAKLLSSAHDCAEGGLAVALAESCIAYGLGARVNLANDVRELFSEDPSRVVVSFPAAQADGVRRLAAQFGVAIREIGRVSGASLAIENVCEVAVSEMRDRHARALESIVGT